jgi:hypothetical protein
MKSLHCKSSVMLSLATQVREHDDHQEIQFPQPSCVSTDTVATTVQNLRTAAIVHLTTMTLPQERRADALQIALRTARENETRWMEMSPEFSTEGERMEQWANTGEQTTG